MNPYPNYDSKETRVISDSVANMAVALEERLYEIEDTPLAGLLERSSDGDLQSALEQWIAEQIDLDDPEIAEAIFQVVSRRAERSLLFGARGR